MPTFISLSDAAGQLRMADRVLVIGCSGGGKSTLSMKLAARFGLEYQSYDRDVFWSLGWQARDRAEQRAIVADLVGRERWIMDGNYKSTFDLRLPRADLVLWLRVPRRVSLMGVARRVLAHYGKVRPDMAEGCPERLPEWQFLSYIWTFERKMTPRIIEGLDLYAPEVPVAVLRSRKDAAALLAS